jgi:hypothetical protein
LNLKCDQLVSQAFAFKCNLSRYAPVQALRVSEAIWCLADGLSADEGVVAATQVGGKKQKTEGGGGASGGAPDAAAVAAAAVAAVRRALSSLPGDHLAPLFPTALGELSPQQAATLTAVHAELAKEYAGRKEMVARRAGVTVQSFSYSNRLKKQPEVARDFLRRAGAGGTQAGLALFTSSCSQHIDL